MGNCPLCGRPESSHATGCQPSGAKAGLEPPPDQADGTGPIFGEVEPATRRTRTILLRLLIPLVCLVGLLTALGLLYRKSFQGAQEVVSYPAPIAGKTTLPGAPDFGRLKPAYMQMVSDGVTKLDRFSGAKYRGSPEALESEATVFQAWSTLINEMDHYPLTDSETETVRSVARKLVAIQTRELPLMRQEWARALRRPLLKYRLYASCAGRRSEVVKVTLPPGPSQEGVDECIGYLVGELPAHLRIAHVEFTFTAGGTLTASLKPRNPAPADSDIVIWRGESYEIVNWKE